MIGFYGMAGLQKSGYFIDMHNYVVLWIHVIDAICNEPGHIGDREVGICLQLYGQVCRQPKRCRSAMLDPKGRAFCQDSGSLLNLKKRELNLISDEMWLSFGSKSVTS